MNFGITCTCCVLDIYVCIYFVVFVIVDMRIFQTMQKRIVKPKTAIRNMVTVKPAEKKREILRRGKL